VPGGVDWSLVTTRRYCITKRINVIKTDLPLLPSLQLLLSSGPCGEPCIDLVFDDPSFFPLHDGSPHSVAIKALLRYSESRLYPVIELLIHAYRHFQRARLDAVSAAHPRLQFELSTLQDLPGLQMQVTGPSWDADSEKVLLQACE